MLESKVLPKHWQIKKLKDICKELQSGKRPKGGVNGIETGIPSIGAEHLNYNGGFKFEKIKFVPQKFAIKMSKGIINKNDIIVVKDGATTGKTSFVGNDFPFEHAVINEHVFILRLQGEVLPKFAFYRLFSATGNKEILEDFRGAAQGGISSGFLDKVNIPIPPLAEQQAIVSKIEELLSDLENSKQQLRLAQHQLKVYRQSILKWAFEGRLTNQNSKNGELPKGWKFEKLGRIAIKITDGEHITPKRTKEGYFLLSARNIQNGYLSLEQVDFVDEGEYKRIVKRCNPEYGDILISCSGSIGRVCKVPKGLKFVLVRSVALVKLDWNNNSSQFYEYLFQSPLLQRQIEKSKKATAQANLFLSPIRNLNIIVCPFNEQQIIATELESKLNVCDKIEETITKSLQQAETLKQSILRQAFEGKLV